MEIKEFVETTLNQIIEGVNGAQKKIDQNDGIEECIINPKWRDDCPHTYEIQLIDFDIAVTVQSDSKSGASANFLSVVGVGAEVKKVTSEHCISRVKFKVPVKYGNCATTDNKVTKKGCTQEYALTSDD